MGEEQRDKGEVLAGKILTALLVVGAAWFFFQLAARGIFSLMMGGNSENGVYVLFYGGLVVLALIFLIGAGSGWALWRRARARQAGGGLTLGLAVVALAAFLLLAGFFGGLLK